MPCKLKTLGDNSWLICFESLLYLLIAALEAAISGCFCSQRYPSYQVLLLTYPFFLLPLCRPKKASIFAGLKLYTHSQSVKSDSHNPAHAGCLCLALENGSQLTWCASQWLLQLHVANCPTLAEL